MNFGTTRISLKFFYTSFYSLNQIPLKQNMSQQPLKKNISQKPLSEFPRSTLVKIADSLDKFGDGAENFNAKLDACTKQEFDTLYAKRYSMSPALAIIDKWMEERNPRLIDFVRVLDSIGRNDELALLMELTPSIRFLAPIHNKDDKSATGIISEKTTPSQVYKPQTPNGVKSMSKDPRAIGTIIGNIENELTEGLQRLLVTFLEMGVKQREEYSKPKNCSQLVSLLESRGLIKYGDVSGLIDLLKKCVDFTSLMLVLTEYQSQF